MNDMVERASQAIWQKLQEAADIDEIARAALKAAFKVTDEDAKAFFDDDDARIDWVVDNKLWHSFGDAMQALSDTALKEES